MNVLTPTSATGRLSKSEPQMQRMPGDEASRSGVRRLCAAMRLSDPQMLLLAIARIHGSVVVAGRKMTREDLMACFNGQQIPKDPEQRKALGLEHMVIDLDYSSLEERVLAMQAFRTAGRKN